MTRPFEYSVTVHKMIQPVPKSAQLQDLILCWGSYPDTSGPIPNVHFDTNINNVNCPDCQMEWRLGNYGRKSNAEEAQATT